MNNVISEIWNQLGVKSSLEEAEGWLCHIEGKRKENTESEQKRAGEEECSTGFGLGNSLTPPNVVRFLGLGLFCAGKVLIPNLTFMLLLGVRRLHISFIQDSNLSVFRNYLG